MNDIHDNIRAIREKLGYSQEYMAAKLKKTQAGYSLIEKGQRKLLYNDLLLIAKVLGYEDESVINVITYPDVYVKSPKEEPLPAEREDDNPAEVLFQVKLRKDKKDQAMKLIFGDNYLEIFNK